MANFIAMNLFLDDSSCRESLFPFTHTRHVADIRLGILTLREKWERITGFKVETDFNNKKEEAISIPANVIPTAAGMPSLLEAINKKMPVIEGDDIRILHHPWEIFLLNDWAIRQDYKLVTSGRESGAVPRSMQCINQKDIFLEEGAEMTYGCLNADTGPIYIGKNVQLMEGSLIRGPFAALDNSVIKMGSKIYGATTLGPHCVAGGEIKNSVLFGYSNKAHDGYLGDSVLGEWCNLGAGTSNSNVKNTGGEVRYKTQHQFPISAGRKAGLLMGDYSRSAINTSFNTGTIIGVCCNIFGDMPGTNVPNFSWGKDRYLLPKALVDIENWKRMKGYEMTDGQKEILENLYSITAENK